MAEYTIIIFIRIEQKTPAKKPVFFLYYIFNIKIFCFFSLEKEVGRGLKTRKS